MVGFTHEASTLLRLKNLTISHLQNKFNALPLFWFQNQLPTGKMAKFVRNQLSIRKLHQTADLSAGGLAMMLEQHASETSRNHRWWVW
jgi:hypothetical protein